MHRAPARDRGCAREEQPTVEEEPYGGATTEPTPTATASQTAPATADEITVQMRAQSDSGETGTATLTRVDATKTKVTLQLENPPAGPQPAHIHTGNCPKPGAVKYPLTNVESGKSETTVAASLDDLLAGETAQDRARGVLWLVSAHGWYYPQAGPGSGRSQSSTAAQRRRPRRSPAEPRPGRRSGH